MSFAPILLLGLAGAGLLLASKSGAKSADDKTKSKAKAKAEAEAKAKAKAKAKAEAEAKTKAKSKPKTADKPQKTVAEMPIELKQMIATALKDLGVDETGTVSGTPTADAVAKATNLASLLDAQGYHAAAEQLRAYAKAAAKKVTVPETIVKVPGLTPEQQDMVNRAIKMERDPRKLRALAAALRLLPNANDPEVKNAADMLDALASQVEAGQEQSQVLTKIDETLKKEPMPVAAVKTPNDFTSPVFDGTPSSAVDQVIQVVKQTMPAPVQQPVLPAAPAPRVYIVKSGDTPYKLAQKYAPGGGGKYMQLVNLNVPPYKKNSKGDNFQNFWAGMTLKWPESWTLPGAAAPTPVVIPAPVLPSAPVAVPVQRTPVEQAAADMVDQLNAVLRNAGGDVKAAKGKEDTGLVSRFQSLAGVKADGKPGPGTLALAAENGQCDLPLVFRWPQGSTSAAVLKYRASLEAIAARRAAAGQTGCANQLRMCAARERGQGGIVGTMPA